MKKGVLLFANNNEQIDYIKQAIFCAKRIKRFTKLHVTLVTDDVQHLKKFPFYKKYINKIIKAQSSKETQQKKFYDGDSYIDATWKNFSRATCYDITPYEQTLVIDTDFIINSPSILECFKTNHDFLINRFAFDLNTVRDSSTELLVSNTSIPMYWATVFYFTKTTKTKILFNLIQHIRNNWSYYKLLYNIVSNTYRNDFAFSIALHILSNHQSIVWPKVLPTLYMITGKDTLLNIEDTKMTLLLQQGQKEIACSITGSDLHIMNKFSLDRYVDKDFANE
tara:strand:- start:4168 stop:5007 length:840 start_codon:yes stop_codon:yes gene_type:complete